MLKCTINGVEVEVKPGTTIIEAMMKSNQRIAHYCWHPGLSVAGVCRLCMVEVEGNPRLQIACNTQVTEGMKVNNTSEKVKDAAKWGLDFHLINHPLDCPICDQAGECGLQEQYMEFGKYDPEMAEKKVKKQKVVDLGPTVVLDSERCILCSRCVRFTDEVTKTHELGIFNRGDRSEIGTHDGKPLDNKYSLNTVDICPVGALTSKDFRFRQRVWYLKDQETICNGCSTGCKVKVYFNKEGFFRVKPVFDSEVNGYWMCDEGRDIYKFVNRDKRLLRAKTKSNDSQWGEGQPGAIAKSWSEKISAVPNGVAVVLTGQYSVEEYNQVFQSMKTKGVTNFYHWMNLASQKDQFDGILLRGDRNPNTKGLLLAAEANGIQLKTLAELKSDVAAQKIKVAVVAGPEILPLFPEVEEVISILSSVPAKMWLGLQAPASAEKWTGEVALVPMKSFVEKEGHFVNFAGVKRHFRKVTTVVSEALTLGECAQLLSGENLMVRPELNAFVEAGRPSDRVTLEHRKKNEFVFKRGQL